MDQNGGQPTQRLLYEHDRMWGAFDVGVDVSYPVRVIVEIAVVFMIAASDFDFQRMEHEQTHFAHRIQQPGR